MRSFIIAVFFLLIVFPSETLLSQKKIASYEVNSTGYSWRYCNQGYEPYCIDKMQISFNNSSSSHISRITFNLKIRMKTYAEKEMDNKDNTSKFQSWKNKVWSGATIYKKKHTVNIDLDPSEEANCDQFSLYNKAIINDDYDWEEDIVFEVEVLSVK